RKKVIVVSSILPEQLDVSTTKNDGPKLLKSYLQFVYQNDVGSKYQGNETEPGLPKLKRVIAPIADKVNAQLVEVVANQNPLVMRDNVFAAVLLTDDDMYYQTPSIKYWHAQLPDLLESKGWPWRKFFSRNYWADPERFSLEVEKWLTRN
ncbi:MAG: hypothetical protein ACKO96_10740, partial [Flammeovirgaceae bacterium]